MAFDAHDGANVWLEYCGYCLKVFCLTSLPPSWSSGWTEKSLFVTTGVSIPSLV